MKFIILLALVGLVSCEIDWSTVQPIRQTKEWQEAFPDFASRVVENSVYDMPRRGGRVIRGDIAGPLDMPYQVGIVVHFPSTNGWCSGSLVSLNFVLSAASCFPGNPTATVLLGASDISRLYDIILANFIRPHESFSTITWRNDIALVQLSYPARLNQYIQLIRLPNLRQVNANFEGRRTNFGGWGQTSDDEEAVPTQKLSFIPAEVISNGACRLRYPTYIWESSICTDTSVGAPCVGDEGGPLTIMEDEVTQIGVFSFIYSRGCDRGWPPVHARITSYLDWIGSYSDVEIRP